MAMNGWPNTPSQLAKELGKSPKTVRSFLRARFPRDEAAKGTTWLLARRHVEAARAHFS